MITIGACTLVTAFYCLVYLCIARAKYFYYSCGAHIISCLLANLMLIVLIGLATTGSVLVAENYSAVKNGSYVDDGKLVPCNNYEIPLVLSILSWMICFLVYCFGCVSCCKCIITTLKILIETLFLLQEACNNCSKMCTCERCCEH